MKAIRIHGHGSIDVLKIDEITQPRPGPGEALIRIKAAALNHLDIFVRNGIPGVPLPIIMGSDGAGVIEDIGVDAGKSSNFSTGDEVFLAPFRTCGRCHACLSGQEQLCIRYHIAGEHFDGMQAEYVVAPLNYLLPKPQGLSWEETAAFPLATLTAYHMLVKKANIRPFYTVLIWGAASGIGSAAIQIAKLYRATVITSAGNDKKMALAKQLGADHALNYKIEDIGKRTRELTGGQGVDIVFEHPGKQTWAQSIRALKRGGKLVTCGAITGPNVEIDLRHLFMKHQQIIGSTMGNRADLMEISKMIEAGKFRPVIGKIFSYNAIKKAHEFLESGQQMGKVVIRF